jgi:hypothetical protein
MDVLGLAIFFDFWLIGNIARQVCCLFSANKREGWQVWLISADASDNGVTYLIAETMK